MARAPPACDPENLLAVRQQQQPAALFARDLVVDEDVLEFLAPSRKLDEVAGPPVAEDERAAREDVGIEVEGAGPGRCRPLPAELRLDDEAARFGHARYLRPDGKVRRRLRDLLGGLPQEEPVVREAGPIPAGKCQHLAGRPLRDCQLAQLFHMDEAEVPAAPHRLPIEAAQRAALHGRMLAAQRGEHDLALSLFLARQIGPDCIELLLEVITVDACELSELAERTRDFWIA